MVEHVQDNDLFLGPPLSRDVRVLSDGSWVVSRYDDVIRVLGHQNAEVDGSVRQLMERVSQAWPERYSAWRNIYQLILLQSGYPHRRLRKSTGRLLQMSSVRVDHDALSKAARTFIETKDVDAISALVEPAIDCSMAPLFGFATKEMTQIRESGVGVYRSLSSGLAQIKPSDFEAENRRLVETYSQVVGRSGDAWTEQDYATVFLCTFGLRPLSDLAANTLAFVAANPELQELARTSGGGDVAFWTEAERYFISARYIHRHSRGDGLRVGEHHVAAGQRIICDIAAANRDPARWPDPDRFDETRAPLSNLAFGAGAHRCLGVALSRQFLPQFLSGILRAARVAPGRLPIKRRCTMAVEEPIEVPLTFKLLETAQ